MSLIPKAENPRQTDKYFLKKLVFSEMMAGVLISSVTKRHDSPRFPQGGNGLAVAVAASDGKTS